LEWDENVGNRLGEWERMSPLFSPRPNAVLRQQPPAQSRARSNIPGPAVGLLSSLEFVNSAGPPGKGNAASKSKIRAHTDSNVPHVCSGVVQGRLSSRFNLEEGRVGELNASPQDSQASRGDDITSDAQTREDSPPVSMPVTCSECGRQQITSWQSPTADQRPPIPHVASP
jgi:hypothetical protein